MSNGNNDVVKTVNKTGGGVPSILIILVWMGPFPNYFDLWLTSAKYNPSVNWLLVTDNPIKDVPENVKSIRLTFEELKEKIRGKFDFPIVLDNPYKLCDYKPAYGDIFREEIQGYDFWGWGDLDLIYGNIRSFLTEDILATHDRILMPGHLSLLRNREDLIVFYKNKAEGCQYYQDVYTTSRSCTFDEWGQPLLGKGFNDLCLGSGLKIYNKMLYADIDIKYNALKNYFGGDTKKEEYAKKRVYFYFSKGRLYKRWKKGSSRGGCIKDGKREVLYVHLQKRKMKNTLKETSDEFYIYPHKFSTKAEFGKLWFYELGYNPAFLKVCFRKLRKK